MCRIAPNTDHAPSSTPEWTPQHALQVGQKLGTAALAANPPRAPDRGPYFEASNVMPVIAYPAASAADSLLSVTGIRIAAEWGRLTTGNGSVLAHCDHRALQPRHSIAGRGG